MKAKIKKTGEIVNIEESATIELEMCDSYGNPICLYPEEIELIEEPTEDGHWQDVRERAAIAAMQGLLSNPAMRLEEGDTYPKAAVIYANVLVAELKKK